MIDNLILFTVFYLYHILPLSYSTCCAKPDGAAEGHAAHDDDLALELNLPGGQIRQVAAEDNGWY